MEMPIADYTITNDAQIPPAINKYTAASIKHVLDLARLDFLIDNPMMTNNTGGPKNTTHIIKNIDPRFSISIC